MNWGKFNSTKITNSQTCFRFFEISFRKINFQVAHSQFISIYNIKPFSQLPKWKRFSNFSHSKHFWLQIYSFFTFSCDFKKKLIHRMIKHKKLLISWLLANLKLPTHLKLWKVFFCHLLKFSFRRQRGKKVEEKEEVSFFLQNNVVIHFTST